MKAERKTMRDVFIEEIYNRMHKDDTLFFVSADLGSPKLDKLRETFKDRFINVGIAEQNLINISTGLALEGFTVYAYAIATFLTMRAYEQIRVNLSLHSQLKELNVNLIGVGAGLSYDVSGPTHHCLEDISIMRTLPHIHIFSPSDWVLAERFVDYSIRVKRPKYLRFDGKPLPQLYNRLDDSDLENGFKELKSGQTLCLVATGYMTHKAMNVANFLMGKNTRLGVVDVFLLKPFNEDLFFETVKRYDQVVTLEEAFVNRGGLDSLVANTLDKKDSHLKLTRLGFGEGYVFDMGSRDHLHKLYNLDEESIIRTVEECLR